MQLLVPVSPGELIDKLTILDIKSERIEDVGKLANIRRERDLLETVWHDSGLASEVIDTLRVELKAVNERLWEIEDAIRDEERASDFGARFVELARSVYFENDRRAAIKKQINLELDSELVEEKSYRDYR